jgi:hypothetical protein
VNFRQTFLAFKNGITNRITQGVGFFIFMFIFNNYNEQQKKL